MKAREPLVPTFPVEIERAGYTTTLRVPYTLRAPVRLQRLLALLHSERWAIVTPPGAISGAGDHSEREAQREELLFVRDCLGPLRARPGAVPEKVVAKLLEVGVLALHKRSHQLFGKPWADFLLGRGPSAALATPEPTPAPTPAQRAAPAPAPAPVAAPPAPLPPALLPLPALAGSPEEEGALLDLLRGPAAPEVDAFDCMLTEVCGYDLDMPAAVELEPASAPPTPGAPCPLDAAAPLPLLPAVDAGWGLASPEADAFLAGLDAEFGGPSLLALPAALAPPAGDGIPWLDASLLALPPFYVPI